MAMTLLKAIETLGDEATVEKIAPLVNIPIKALAQEVVSYSTRGWITIEGGAGMRDLIDESVLKTLKLRTSAAGRELMARGLA